VVHAEESSVRLFAMPPALLQYLRKLMPYVPTFVREAGQSHAPAPDIDHSCLGTSEDVQVGMGGQVFVRNS
jgi:hypothetical protein